MNLICERDALKTALSHVTSRTRGKTKIPILQHVLLEAGQNKLALTGTDLDTRSIATCAAEIADAGSITVSADHFARLVEGMPQGGQVSLELKGHDLHTVCGRSRYKLPTLPAIDFPEWTGIKEGSEVTLKSDEAKQLFGRPEPAVSTEQTRFYLCGGHLSKRKGDIALTATNGVSLVRLSLPSAATLQRECIVPRAAMAEIVKLAAGGDVKLKLDQSQIEVEVGNVVFSSKLIDANFPDTDRAIPAVQTSFIQVDRHEFISAFKRLAALADDNSTIDFRWKTGETTLEVELSGNGSGTESVACECDLESGAVSFSPRILGEMLDVPAGELVQFHIMGSGSPMLIVDPNDSALTVVAMPCRGRV